MEDNNIPESLKKFNAMMILRGVVIVLSIVMLILGFLSFLSIFSKFSFSTLILSIDIIIFSAAVVLSELRLQIFTNTLSFLQTNIGRGGFYFFVGTLCFGLVSWSSVTGIILGIDCILLTISSFAYIFFSAYQSKMTSKGFAQDVVDFDNANDNYGASSGGGGGYSDLSGRTSVVDTDSSSFNSSYTGFGDYVQDQVSTSVANSARNEENQRKIGANVGNMAQDREFQKQMGQRIADNSDYAVVGAIANNETVQQYAGNAVNYVANNRTAQQWVGEKVASTAEDKEMQKKVANAALSGAKSTASAGWEAGNAYILE